MTTLMDSKLPPDISMVDPLAAHDDLSFAELTKRYNFRQTSQDARVFTRLIIKECKTRLSPVHALDIGCGCGINMCTDYQWAIRQHVDEYVGVEPDAEISPLDGLFDHHHTTLMDYADLPENHFDVLYSWMVMEHVADPIKFMQSVYRCLKPGGVYLFVTPNRRHYFTRISATLHHLRLNELVLRMLRKSEVDDYHYPVQYRFNREKQINECAQHLGFHAPEYAYLENEGPKPYFPKPLRFIFHALAAKRRVIRNQKSLLRMVCRFTKPES